MMHGFSMAVGVFWVLIPLLLIAFGVPLIARLVRGMRKKRIGDSRGSGPSGESIDATLYRLAKENDGILTVSDVVVATGMPAERAEKALEKLTDGTRVGMEVTEDGRVVYEFVELRDTGSGPGF